MYKRLNIVLEQTEYAALLDRAIRDLRNPSDQARFILRQELVRTGDLVPENGNDCRSEHEEGTVE